MYTYICVLFYQKNIKYCSKFDSYMCVFFSSRYFWNIAMGDVDRSFPFNFLGIAQTRSLHSTRIKNMTNIPCIEKRNFSCFCSACIDQTKSIDDCEN